MTENYRDSVRDALKRARVELESLEDIRLRYAALELRMALEGLVYERALLFSEELSNKKLSTWQPGKLLNLLLSIDPYADKSPTLSFGIEQEPGVPAKEMFALGTDRVLSLAEIKKYYDRLGSFLHTPTIEQLAKEKSRPRDEFRSKCNEIYRIVEEVLDSKVFNVSIKSPVSINCMCCDKKIIRRIPYDKSKFLATCVECSATYDVFKTENDGFEWRARIHKFNCANPTCGTVAGVWDRDLEIYACWECKVCKRINRLGYGVELLPEVPLN